MNNTAPSRTARLVLALGVLGYLGFYLAWTLLRHAYFDSYGFDLGIHDQAAWLLSQGKNPFSTVCGRPYFGDHLYFTMLAVAPLYWLGGGAETLIILQVLAFGLAAVPAFLVARELLRSEWMACAVALAYLLNPYVGWMTLDQFHPDAFEVCLVFLAFFFAVSKRWRGFIVVVVLLLLSKEDTPLLVIGLGLWVAFRCRQRLGVFVAALAALWLFLNFRVLLPAFGGTGSLATYLSAHTSRIPFGGLGGFVRTLLTRPWQVISAAFGAGRPLYYLQVFGSLGFLSFRSPTTVAAVALPLVFNGLSTFWYQHSLKYHYGALVVPGLLVAAIYGIAYASARLRWALVSLLVVSAVLSLWLWGPVPYSRQAQHWPKCPANAQAVRDAIALVPADAVVSADYRFVTHLAHRTEIYEYPNPWLQRFWGDGVGAGEALEERAQRVSYVLVYRQQEKGLETVLNGLLEGGEFDTLYDNEGVLLLRRIGDIGDP